MSNDKDEALHTHHKEECQGHIKTDQATQLSLRNTFDMCINPLDDASHLDGALMNIVTEVAHPDVNADDSLSIGQKAIQSFKCGWPGSFYDTLAKIIVTMDVKKKHVLVGKECVYDQELIYACVIGLLVSSQDINFDDVLSCELAAYPPSMFSSDGQSKSTLKKNLQVAVSACNCPIPDTVIYNVSALLWVINWPSDKLCLYVDAFNYLCAKHCKLGMLPWCLTGIMPAV